MNTADEQEWVRLRTGQSARMNATRPWAADQRSALRVLRTPRLVAQHSRLPVVATSQPRLLTRTVLARATVAATEMKSAVPQTYPRYRSGVGNMGRGETFAESSDEIGDSTGNFQYSFLRYCAGRVG